MKGVKSSLHLARMRFFFLRRSITQPTMPRTNAPPAALPATTSFCWASAVNIQATAPATPASAQDQKEGDDIVHHAAGGESLKLAQEIGGLLALLGEDGLGFGGESGGQGIAVDGSFDGERLNLVTGERAVGAGLQLIEFSQFLQADGIFLLEFLLIGIHFHLKRDQDAFGLPGRLLDLLFQGGIGFLLFPGELELGGFAGGFDGDAP